MTKLDKGGLIILTKGNKNLFTLLQKYDMECYKCNNHGHMARDCKLKTPTRNTVVIKSQKTKQKNYGRERSQRFILSLIKKEVRKAMLKY